MRGLAAGWNAEAQHHYHLACGELARSTLADAGARRPPAVFAEAFGLLAGQLDRQTRGDADAMLRIIDSTPIPLGKLCDWAKSNGRFRGLKMHVVFNPGRALPRVLDITDANVNDARVGRAGAVEAGATHVFDKGYCHYGWWRAIDAAGSFFVTRPKTNMGLAVARARPLGERAGEGFVVLADEEVRFASKGDSKLPIALRRVTIERDDGRQIALLTNDLARSAVEVGALYKARWQIELLFRWLKQHLKIRRFLGNNDNAIRLQLYAAMIAYALLRLAARANAVKLPFLRFVDLVATCLFERRKIGAIEKPPPVNPTRASQKTSPDQLGFCYA